MTSLMEQTWHLLDLLGHDEAPFGVIYGDEKPEGFGPPPGERFTREREEAGLIDWSRVQETFSCILGNIWLARRKRQAACISHEACGCLGGGFYAGLYRPYLNFNVHYVSTGLPQAGIEGEHYMPSPESMRTFLDEVAPPPATGACCVFKPLEQFGGADPLTMIFFARPEVLSGLHSLAVYATGDPHAVTSPFASACAAIVAWPLVYQERGENRAVLGGFDLSARKFMKTDELTFAVPLGLYRRMLGCMDESALGRGTWQNVRKKVARSVRAWEKRTGVDEKVVV